MKPVIFHKFIQFVRFLFNFGSAQGSPIFSLSKRIKIDRANNKFLLIFFTGAILFVCLSCSSHLQRFDENQTNSVRSTAQADMRVVNHALGSVEIPLKPQRVIVLHHTLILDSVIALGVKPIGITYCECGIGERFPGVPNELLINIAEVGSSTEPSLEKILSLKPDLILGTVASHGKTYGLLSSIAPTVLLDTSNGLFDFKERLLYIAEVLGVSNRVDDILAQYQARILQLQQQLKKRPEAIEVSYIAIVGQIFISHRLDFTLVNHIFDDVGFRRLAIQQKQKEKYLNLNIEFLPKYDADVLFVDSNFLKQNPGTWDFMKHPIWSQLKAFQTGRVYEVNWGVNGPLGANRVIDDLFKYLVNTP